MHITSEHPVLVQCKANGMVSQKLEFKIVGKNTFENCRKITVAAPGSQLIAAATTKLPAAE